MLRSFFSLNYLQIRSDSCEPGAAVESVRRLSIANMEYGLN